MKRMSKAQTVGTAAAIAALAVTAGMTTVAHATPTPTSPAHSQRSATTDTPTAGDKADSSTEAADHEKASGPDTDHVQQGDQSGSDARDATNTN